MATSLTALEIVQRTVNLLGITTAPTSIVGTTDPQITNLLAILNDAGQDLASRHNWSSLMETMSFTSTGVDPQAEPLPADYDRTRSNASLWRSGSLLTPLSGPCPPDIWHRLLVMPGIRFPGYWRMFGGNIEIIGAPSGETVTVEYMGNGWVTDGENGAVKTSASKDSDTFKLPSRLLSLAMIWNWRSTKGLTYAEELTSFERQFERDVAADRSARPVALDRPFRSDAHLRTWPGAVITS